MKNLFSLLLLGLALTFFTSCGDDDEGGSAFNFIDQNAQGSINGVAFEFQGGTASDDGETLSIDMFDLTEVYEEVCDVFFGESISIFLFVPNEVGLYEFSFDFTTFGQSATLYDPAESLNIISTEGAIEILEITDTQVTGRIDARVDGETNVNGNFALDICN